MPTILAGSVICCDCASSSTLFATDTLSRRRARRRVCHAIESELSRAARPSTKPLSSTADSGIRSTQPRALRLSRSSRASSHACSKTSRRWRHAMNERVKITPSHLARHAIVYLRQSSAAQVEHNRESTDRQYALGSKASDLGWPDERIMVITRISAFPVLARWRVRALPASPPRWRLPARVSCLVTKSRGWRAIMPNGTA